VTLFALPVAGLLAGGEAPTPDPRDAAQLGFGIR